MLKKSKPRPGSTFVEIPEMRPASIALGDDDLKRAAIDAQLINRLFSLAREGTFVQRDPRRIRIAMSMLSATIRELEHGLGDRSPHLYLRLSE